jgi:hypothetical protein
MSGEVMSRRRRGDGIYTSRYRAACMEDAHPHSLPSPPASSGPTHDPSFGLQPIRSFPSRHYSTVGSLPCKPHVQTWQVSQIWIPIKMQSTDACSGTSGGSWAIGGPGSMPHHARFGRCNQPICWTMSHQRADSIQFSPFLRIDRRAT